jgi:hypothetical protein
VSTRALNQEYSRGLLEICRTGDGDGRLAWVCKPDVAVVVYDYVIHAVEIVSEVVVEQGYSFVCYWI